MKYILYDTCKIFDKMEDKISIENMQSLGFTFKKFMDTSHELTIDTDKYPSIEINTIDDLNNILKVFPQILIDDTAKTITLYT